MDRILLGNLLRLSEEDRQNTKVKFNVWNGYEHPLDVFKRDPELVNRDWLLWKPDSGERYFAVGNIAINLIPIGCDEWLMTTIQKITEDIDISNGIGYESEPVSEYECYFGRVVLKCHKSHRRTVVYYGTVADSLEVLKILPTFYDDDEFPGYENVCLSYEQLSIILSRRKSSWIAAFENQKAVYLITDRMTGKLYVGSATSDNGMLLARWTSYVENGTGGNARLVELKKEKGFDYIKKNFQYSILENYNARVPDDYILGRESWWKRALCSREFGYNAN